MDELQLFDEVAETLRALLPADYDDVASNLRQVDPLEQGEIRVELAAGVGK